MIVINKNTNVMKKIILAIFILIITIRGSAQEYSIGAETGLHYDFISIVNDYNRCKQSLAGYDMGNMSFIYISKKQLIFKTGIAYQNYMYNIGLKFFSSNSAFPAFKPAFRSIYIPLRIGHQFKLSEKLFFNAYSGIDMILYFDQMHKLFNDTIGSTDFVMRTLTVNTTNALKNGANIALVTGIDFTLKTKYNIAYSLFCSYHAGLFDTWHCKGILTQSNENIIYEPVFISKGSHLNFGIGISYTFRKD